MGVTRLNDPLMAYPVGSIYMSVNSASPATLFGGTWERIQDAFLLAAGTNHAAGTTGGEETHKLTAAESGVPAHAHGMAHRHTHAHTHGMGHRHTHAHTHSYSKAASHQHTLSAAGGAAIDLSFPNTGNIIAHSTGSNVTMSSNHVYNNFWNDIYTAGASERSKYTKALTGKTDATTPGATATNSGAASTNYTGNSINTGSDAGRTSTDAASTNYSGGSINTGNDNARNSTDNNTAAAAANAHNNMPPYLAVYVWKRTA